MLPICPAAIIDFDATIVFQLALFLGLLVALRLLVFGPMLSLFARRKEETEGRMERARDGMAEAEKLHGAYRVAMQEAAVRGDAVRSRARQEALAGESTLLAAARSEASARFERDAGAFAGEIAAARKSADEVVASLAAEIVERLSSGRSRGGERR